LRAALVGVSVALWCVSGLVIWEAKRLPVIPGTGLGPDVVPFWLAVLLTVFAAVLLAELRSKKGKPASVVDTAELVEVGVVFLLIVLYVAIISLVGYAASTFLLVLLLMRRLGRYALWKCALSALLVSVASAFAFRQLLQVPLPPGLLGF